MAEIFFKAYVDELKVVIIDRKPSIYLKHSREELITILQDLGYHDLLGEGAETVMQKLVDIAVDYLGVFCPIGRLFGNQSVAAKLRFIDTILDVWDEDLELRPGVGIDRKSGSVQRDVLFFVRVLPAGTSMLMRFVADGLRRGEADTRLLAGVLDWVAKLGLQVGGRKSTGLGLLKIEDAVFYVAELDSEDGWQKLSNPFKHGDKLNFQQFISWATS